MFSSSIKDGVVVRIKNCWNKYLYIKNTGVVLADGSNISEASTFVLVKKGENCFSLYCTNGHYISVTDDKRLICASTLPLKDETLEITVLHDNCVSLRSLKNHKFISIQKDFSIEVNRESANEWEMFYLE